MDPSLLLNYHSRCNILPLTALQALQMLPDRDQWVMSDPSDWVYFVNSVLPFHVTVNELRVLQLDQLAGSPIIGDFIQSTDTIRCPGSEM